MITLGQRHTRGRSQHGSKYDPAELESAHQSVKDAYESGLRVRVEGPAGTRTGVVSTTAGWRPAFLLMHRSSDHGSWDLIGPEDQAVAVRRGRRYIDSAPARKA